MTKTMRILIFLLLMVVGTGQTWADEEPVQFGTVMYNGTAENDGGTLEFYMSSRVHEEGNKLTLTNGQSAALTDYLDEIWVWNGVERQSVGKGFFIKATPAVGRRLPVPDADGTVGFIQAEVVTSAQQAPSRRNAPDPTMQVGQTLPVKFHAYYESNDQTATDYYGIYYVVMPADANLSVSITADFPEAITTTVSYIDPTKTVDAQNCSVTAYVLDGTEAILGYGSYKNRTRETWYVCNDDITYANGLECYGKVHLILADGATMTVGTDSEPIVGTPIYDYGDLTIYGQGNQSGKLTATSLSNDAILVGGDFAINGGIINAKSDGQIGIHSDNHLTINGGTVTSTSTVQNAIYAGCITIKGGTVTATGNCGLSCGSGIGEYGEISTCRIIINGGIVTCNGTGKGIRAEGDVVINGGQVTSTVEEAGIYSMSGDIILGWTNPTDFITASSYLANNYNTSGKAVKTADGQRLVAFNAATGTAASTIVSGTVDDVTTLAGKTLKPLEGNYVSINATDFTFTGTTSTTSPFTITTGEGENASTIHYYIYKKDDTAKLSYTGSGFVNVTGATLAAVENQPLQRTFTMAAADVTLTTTPVTGLTAASVTYNGTAQVPVIKQGDDVFDAANYTIAYQLGDDVVTEAKNVGNYTCTMTGLGQYIGTTTVPFAITKRSTSLAVEIVDPVTTIDGHPLLIAGDDAHLKVTLVPVAGEGETNLPKINGYVTLSVNDGINLPKPYTVAIVNGEGHYYVSNLIQGAYNITAEFAGDANHAESTSAATTLEACMILTETTCSVDKTEINVGESVTVTAKINEVGLQRPVNDNETGKNKEYLYPKADVKPLSIDAAITVILDGSASTVGVTNGTGTITFKKLLVHQDLPPHIDAGDIWRELRDHYVFVAIYAGNDRYNWSESGYVRLKVNRIPITINASVTSPVIAK